MECKNCELNSECRFKEEGKKAEHCNYFIPTKVGPTPKTYEQGKAEGRQREYDNRKEFCHVFILNFEGACTFAENDEPCPEDFIQCPQSKGE